MHQPRGSAWLLAVHILPHLGVGESVHLLVLGLDVDVEAGSLHEAVVTIVALVRFLSPMFFTVFILARNILDGHGPSSSVLYY